MLAQPGSKAEVLDRLVDRFERREQAEVERIARVVSLVTHDGCQVNELVGYFGEVRAEPCGHCTFCLTGRAQSLPEPGAQPPLASEVKAAGRSPRWVEARPKRSAAPVSGRGSFAGSRARRRPEPS